MGMDQGFDAPDTRPVALVLRALGLGDLLVAVPALRAIRRALPDHRLIVATSPWVAPVLELVPGVDAMVGVSGLGASLPVPAGAVDVAVNLHGGGPESRSLVQALRARRTVTHVPPGEPGTVWLERMHERERWVRLVADAGMPGDPDEVAIIRPASAGPAPAVVVVHVGAAFGSRRWPVERFAAVAARLAAAGRRIVFSGGTEERALALEAARLAGLGDESVLAGILDLASFAALVADAALLVTGDTGAAHLASAFRTPSIVLFGPVGPERWGPPPGPHLALTDASVRRGDPFTPDPDPALLAVTVDVVLTASARLLDP